MRGIILSQAGHSLSDGRQRRSPATVPSDVRQRRSPLMSKCNRAVDNFMTSNAGKRISLYSVTRRGYLQKVIAYISYDWQGFKRFQIAGIWRFDDLTAANTTAEPILNLQLEPTSSPASQLVAATAATTAATMSPASSRITVTGLSSSCVETVPSLTTATTSSASFGTLN